MLKKALLILPLLFVIGACRKDASDESAGDNKTYTQEQIDSGDAPSAAQMGGGGEGNRDGSDD